MQGKNDKEVKRTLHRLSNPRGRQLDVGLRSRQVRKLSENKVVAPRMALETLRANFWSAKETEWLKLEVLLQNTPILSDKFAPQCKLG